SQNQVHKGHASLRKTRSIPPQATPLSGPKNGRRSIRKPSIARARPRNPKNRRHPAQNHGGKNQVLVVLANRTDATAAGLVSAWVSQDAALLTADDLSRAGWRHHPGAHEASTAVIGGRVVPVREIDAVLTKMPCVTEADLPHIVTEDRSYVAMEMTSFLVAWLSALECKVINKPRPACLVGPNWREAEWVRLAAETGMRVRTLRRECAPGVSFQPLGFEGVPATATVIGRARFGTVDSTLKDQAERLA